MVCRSLVLEICWILGVSVWCPPCLGLQAFLAGLPTCRSGAVALMAAGCRIEESTILSMHFPSTLAKRLAVRQHKVSAKPCLCSCLPSLIPPSPFVPASLGPRPCSPLCSRLPGSVHRLDAFPRSLAMHHPDTRFPQGLGLWQETKHEGLVNAMGCQLLFFMLRM